MTRSIEVKVPDIGDFSDVPVIEVLVSAGDSVAAGGSLITLESDKATMEVPSPESGTVREIRVAVGDRVSMGHVIAVIESQQQTSTAAAAVPEASPPPQDAPPDPVPAAPALPARPAPAEPPPPVAAPRGIAAVDPSAAPYASPAVRQFARELGVVLARVKGSGSGGRILREDVSAFVKSVMSAPAPAPEASPGFALPPPPRVDFTQFGKVSEQELSRIQKISARHLHRNWVGIPHVTQHDEADITDMEAFRKSIAGEAEAQGFKLTPLVFLIKASVAALKRFPQFNASLDESGEKLILKEYFNIGIAVDTPEGLVVPVLRECERKGIMALARELAEVSARAREKKLRLQDIEGGCFTISSLGGIGGTGFTPIINAPEVAILGVSRSRMRPAWDGAAFQPRLMLPLSLSYDHRVIDGAVAARFTRFLAEQLEDLRRLAL